MNLKNYTVYCELRSENPVEAKALFAACRRSYSPRMCGLMPNNDQLVVIQKTEAKDFVRGIMDDVDLGQHDKWLITKLLSEWMIGNVREEACAQ